MTTRARRMANTPRISDSLPPFSRGLRWLAWGSLGLAVVAMIALFKIIIELYSKGRKEMEDDTPIRTAGLAHRVADECPCCLGR